MSAQKTLLMIFIVALFTFLTRAMPFLLFGGKRELPSLIRYLAGILPSAMIATLVVYCLKNINLLRFPFGLPELLSSGGVVLLHLWKRNTLLSIGGGTLIYMLLIRIAV